MPSPSLSVLWFVNGCGRKPRSEKKNPLSASRCKYRNQALWKTFATAVSKNSYCKSSYYFSKSTFLMKNMAVFFFHIELKNSSELVIKFTILQIWEKFRKMYESNHLYFPTSCIFFKKLTTQFSSGAILCLIFSKKKKFVYMKYDTLENNYSACLKIWRKKTWTFD